MMPAFTLGAGLAHAMAGALTGPRLVDATRTRTSWHAALLGAATSLLAVAFFAPVLAVCVTATNVRHSSALGYETLTLFTSLFASIRDAQTVLHSFALER
jgi:hypothetical protein